MNTNLLLKILLAFLLLALLAPIVLADQKALQTTGPTVKSPMSGMPNMFPLRMNNTGWRVGYSLAGETERAALWTAAGCRELLPVKDAYSCAYGVNNEGSIVGQMDTIKVDRGGRVIRQAFLWRDDVLMNIDELRSFRDSAALDINRKGWVAGWVGVEDVGNHAALWTFLEYTERGPKIIDLGTLGGQNSIAYSLNGFGLVVGQAETEVLVGDPLRIAFRYEYPMEVGMQALPALALGRDSAALDVNDAGVIVGWAQNEIGQPRAVVWEDGKVADLGGFGGTEARANAINARGLIVGTATLPLPKLPKSGCFAPIERAFVVRDGEMIDLNSFISPSADWLLLEARDINDRDEVTGYGWSAGDMWGYVLRLPPPGKTLGTLTPIGPVDPNEIIKQ